MTKTSKAMKMVMFFVCLLLCSNVSFSDDALKTAKLIHRTGSVNYIILEKQSYAFCVVKYIPRRISYVSVYKADIFGRPKELIYSGIPSIGCIDENDVFPGIDKKMCWYWIQKAHEMRDIEITEIKDKESPDEK